MSPNNVQLSVSPYLYPLDEFYAQAGRSLPAIEPLSGDAVPEPFRQLLVHSDDMTPTLETFFGETLHLEILSRQQRESFYFREVVLAMDQTGHLVEFGAIKINLNLFPATARRQILEERIPLGHILQELKIAHESRPKAFLKLVSDSFINGALKLPYACTVYGRRNVLLDPAHRALAEVVEILPPILNGKLATKCAQEE